MERKSEENREERQQNARDMDTTTNNDNATDTNTFNEAEGIDAETTEDAATDDTDKYLAIEQPGVQFTQENDPTVNSDQMDFGTESKKREWNDEGGNSKNSEAFNQDDYILDDNVDLDEDQNQSISSDDDDFEESNERYTN